MGKKILVIDDEELITKSLFRLLSKEGYSATIAKSGMEAIEKIKVGEFDLIICDVRMPEMDGVTILQKIREIDDKVAVIMLTAYPNRDALKWSEKLNVTAFIPKLSAHSDMDSSLKSAIEMAGKRLRR